MCVSPAAASSWSVSAVTSSGGGVAWGNSAAMTDNGTGVIVYADFSNGNSVAYLRRKVSGGAWQSQVRLSAQGICYGTVPAVDANGSNVDVVWVQETGSDCTATTSGQAYYMHSSDNGAHFTSPQGISGSTLRAGEIDVASGPNGEVLIGWTDDSNGKMYVRSSTDGVAFGSAQLIGTTKATPWDGSSTLDGAVGVAIGSGVQYVAYLSNQSTIQVRRSTDGGASWSAATKITGQADGYSELSITAEGSRADIGFAALAKGHEWAQYRETKNGGASWKKPTNLTTPSQPYGTYTGVGLKDGTLRATYSRCVTASCDVLAVYYRQQKAGKSMSAAVRVSAPAAWSYAAGVAGVGNASVVMYYTYNVSSGDAYAATKGL